VRGVILVSLENANWFKKCQHINYCSHAEQLTFNCHKGGGSVKYLRKIASNIDMNIVHAYPIQNEEFLLRFSHLTNYLDRYDLNKKITSKKGHGCK
jgi:hypothetical protein